MFVKKKKNFFPFINCVEYNYNLNFIKIMWRIEL